MRALDDTENPYEGKYAEWDYWAYANAKELTDKDWELVSQEKPDRQLKYLSYGVDKNGFPVPYLQQMSEQYAQMEHPEQQAESTCSVSFSVFGPISEELAQRMFAAEMELKAPHVPAIPEWLAAQPPLWAMILPTGEIVTVGEPGSGGESEENFSYVYGFDPCPHASRRYSAEGKQLAQVEAGHDWYELFWPDAPKVLKGYDDADHTRSLELGYIVVRDTKNWDVTAIYNYDGTPQPTDIEPYTRNGLVWYGLSGRELPAIYAVQHAAEKESR